jgi:hypothetical protein
LGKLSFGFCCLLDQCLAGLSCHGRARFLNALFELLMAVVQRIVRALDGQG